MLKNYISPWVNKGPHIVRDLARNMCKKEFVRVV